MLNEEIARRNRIQELLKNDLMKEYISLSHLEPMKMDSTAINEMLESILQEFTIEKTNGIYVCTGTYFTDWRVCYEETYYTTKQVEFDSEDAEFRIYCDIESDMCVTAYKKIEKEEVYKKITTSEFECTNIVLNPYNSNQNRNGYSEVRSDFFINAIKYGQPKSKRLLLDKYRRM